MLELSTKNVQLSGSAGNKNEAIHLVASGLVANGNVQAGYENGMLAREEQTSTFLGNGIAIPHGTLDTRDLVQNTGVQVYQFPQGVEWSEGNTAYVVIGIAAKSDEHLELLRQLTSVLGDEEAAETLAKTQDVDEFIAILSGKKALSTISEELVTLNVETSSLITLSAMNAGKLQEAGYVAQSFVGEALDSKPLALGDNVFLVDAASGNEATGVAVSRSANGETVVTVSSVDNSLEKPLEELLDSAIREELTSGSVKRIVAMFGGKVAKKAKKEAPAAALNEGEVEAVFTIKNEHGLHARPAATLVNEVKKYNATIKVQNVNTNSALVSAKSMMKVVSLGVVKDTQLRFVASGEEAQKALEGIGAAIEAGLGE